MVEDLTLPQVVASNRDAFPPHPLDPNEPDEAWADIDLDMEPVLAETPGKHCDKLDPTGPGRCLRFA